MIPIRTWKFRILTAVPHFGFMKLFRQVLVGLYSWRGIHIKQFTGVGRVFVSSMYIHATYFVWIDGIVHCGLVCGHMHVISVLYWCRISSSCRERFNKKIARDFLEILSNDANAKCIGDISLCLCGKWSLGSTRISSEPSKFVFL